MLFGIGLVFVMRKPYRSGALTDQLNASLTSTSRTPLNEPPLPAPDLYSLMIETIGNELSTIDHWLSREQPFEIT